ncbi:MAG: hypothetical protein KF774_11650 [Planctomyces sp.]|nr:hypothetical protein [Planctomyces sp.]
MRFRMTLLAGILALSAVTAMAAATIKVSFTYMSGKDYMAYTYRTYAEGIPPMPREEIIMGGTMQKFVQPNPYLTHYKLDIFAYQHYVGTWYPWKVKEYTDLYYGIVSDMVFTQGISEAE